VNQLRITEIFYSLQGEARNVGLPTVFIRLTGCPLRCQYCDTSYAFDGGQLVTMEAVLERTRSYAPRFVTVTGGEPLAQPGSLDLLSQLCDEGYEVSLETSGAMDIAGVDNRVSIVLDLKTPGSREVSKNLYENIELLGPKDQLKVVICDRGDYDWAKFKLSQYNIDSRVGEILFSASHQELPSVQLADWILEDNLPVRLQIQLHKYLWGDKPGV